MSGTLLDLGSLALFLAGLRLSAFFSGAETGFYRASSLRLSIDAQAGDPVARRILRFCQNPSDFVVTALVGNNVAHYLVTAAVGIAASRAGLGEGMAVEIASTLLIAPLVFTFGELIPKNAHYRAPLQLLRREANLFFQFYRLFLPISLPLMAVTRVLERLSGSNAGRPGEIFGRARLVQVLSQGHQEGLLTDVQRRLIEGLMYVAGQPVARSITPTSRILGVHDNSDREDVLKFAQRYGLNSVAVRRSSEPESWYGYVRVVDLALTQRPLASLAKRMPVIDESASKLEALVTLRIHGADYGLVKSGERLLGIASHHGLSEQLFRAPHAIGARFDDGGGSA